LHLSRENLVSKFAFKWVNLHRYIEVTYLDLDMKLCRGGKVGAMQRWLKSELDPERLKASWFQP
jgi:hypothetical protein